MSLNSANVWFRYGKLTRFRMPIGYRMVWAVEPDDWFEHLKARGFIYCACSFRGLLDGTIIAEACWHTIEHWLPTTSSFEMELIWEPTDEKGGKTTAERTS